MSRISLLEQQSIRTLHPAITSSENLHKGMQNSLSNDNLVLPEIDQAEYVSGLSKGICIAPDSNSKNVNQQESKKFMATSDFRMYDPVKKTQVRNLKEKGIARR